MSQTQNTPAQKTVSIVESINLLKSGYVRYKKDEKEEGKSIQSYYGLNGAQAKTLFAHDKLKNLKTSTPVAQTLLIIDDTEPVATQDNATAELNQPQNDQPAVSNEVVAAENEAPLFS